MTATVSYGKTNYNGTCTAGATKDVAPEMASRTRFNFSNLGSVVMVLNFGASATASNVLTVRPGTSVEIKNNDVYDCRQRITVFSANADNFEAQASE